MINVQHLIGMREEMEDIYQREASTLNKVAVSLSQQGFDPKTIKKMKATAMKSVKAGPQQASPGQQQLAAKLEAAGRKFREQRQMNPAQAQQRAMT